MMQRNGKRTSRLWVERGVGRGSAAAAAVLPRSTDGGRRRADVWRPCTQYGRTSCVWILCGREWDRWRGDSADADSAARVSAVSGGMLCGVWWREVWGGGCRPDGGGSRGVCAAGGVGGEVSGEASWAVGGVAGGALAGCGGL